MMKIESVSTNLLNVPSDKFVSDATHSGDHFEVVTCSIGMGGSEGLGFTYTIGEGGKAIKELLDSYLSRRLNSSA